MILLGRMREAAGPGPATLLDEGLARALGAEPAPEHRIFAGTNADEPVPHPELAAMARDAAGAVWLPVAQAFHEPPDPKDIVTMRVCGTLTGQGAAKVFDAWRAALDGLAGLAPKERRKVLQLPGWTLPPKRAAAGQRLHMVMAGMVLPAQGDESRGCTLDLLGVWFAGRRGYKAAKGSSTTLLRCLHQAAACAEAAASDHTVH